MLNNIKANTRAKKLLFPSVTTFFMGLESILFALIGYGISMNEVNETILGVSAMAIFETFSLVIVFTILGFKNISKLIKKFRSKKGTFFILATIIGTSFGNLFLFLAITYAGPYYGVVLTALYPIFTMLLIKFFMKQKENWKVWIGVSLTFVSSVIFIMFPVFKSLRQENNNFEFKQMLGMIFGMVAAFFWSIESFFLKKGLLVKKDSKFSDLEINATRHFFSWITTWIFLMPLMCIFGNTFIQFAKLVTNWKIILICLAIAINLAILRILHIRSLKLVGPKITVIFESSNFIVPSLLSFVLFLLPNGLNQEPIFEMMDWEALIILFPIVIGVWMTIYFNEDDEKQMQIH